MIKKLRISALSLTIAVWGWWLAIYAEEEQYEHAASETQSLGSLPIFVIVITILVALLVWFLINRKQTSISNKKENISACNLQKDYNCTNIEREEGLMRQDFLKYMEDPILEMLAKCGGELSLEEIGHNLNMPTHVIATKLWEMDKAGLITRKWADKSMFGNKKQNELNRTILVAPI
jgi:hypothetical protein